MSFVDAIIPAVFGILLVFKPEALFIGSKAEPTEARLKLLRRAGWLLLVVAVLFSALAWLEV